MKTKYIDKDPILSNWDQNHIGTTFAIRRNVLKIEFPDPKIHLVTHT